jgi:hypothetical protein
MNIADNAGGAMNDIGDLENYEFTYFDYFAIKSLIEINKPIPNSFVDMSSTPVLGNTQMNTQVYEFINDPIYDPNDTQITYFNPNDIDYPIKLFK